jgi:outer membrane protein assembly factor BamB
MKIKLIFYLTFALAVTMASCSKDDPAPSTQSVSKEIKSFVLGTLNPAVTATIDASAKTIKAELPAGTDLTKLSPTITLAEKATVSPATGIVQDFSKPVTYTVTAEDGSTQVYTVTLTIQNNGTVFLGNLGGLYALDAITGAKKWVFETENFIDGTPTVANGIVYFTSWDKKLYALDVVTGEKKWEFLHGMGQSFWSPMVADGMIYFGGDPYFYALDAATGAKKWEFKGDETYTFEASPTVVNGVVYASLRGTAFSNQGVGTFALDAKTGAKIWTKPTGVWVTESSPAVVDNIVYTGSEGDGLLAFDATTGAKKWQFKDVSCAISSPTVFNGMVYIGSGTFGTGNDKLYALDAASGDKKWEFPTPDGESDYSSPIVANGVVYIGAGSTLYAVDAASGAKKWEAKPEEHTLIYSGAVVAMDLVYIGIGKKVYAFDAANGVKKWEFLSEKGFNQSSPCVIAKDNKVYHAGVSGMVQ